MQAKSLTAMLVEVRFISKVSMIKRMSVMECFILIVCTQNLQRDYE